MTRHRICVRPARDVAPAFPRPLTRRHLVGGAIGAAGAAAIGAGLVRPGGGLVGRAGWASAQVGVPLPEIWERTPEGGLLNVTLVATRNPTPGGTPLAYALATDPGSDARSPGPTLRLGRGDRLRIHLVNDLVDVLGSRASTNLHVHGLHVSPSRNSDNIFVHVDSGAGHASFDFEYQIPENHRSGLFWYHPHLHGTTATQVQRGLAGAIIIEERDSDPAAVKDQPPEVNDVPERLLVLQHLVVGAPANHRPLVNGAHLPDIDFRPGEREWWRIVNASSDTFFNLYLGEEIVFHRVGADGNWLEETDSLAILPLGPAERAEVLIDWGHASSYQLSTLKPDNGPIREKPADAVLTPLANLVPPDSIAFAPAAPLAPPGALLPLADLRDIPLVPERALEFQADDLENLLIDGKTFSSGRVDQTVELGGIEQWMVRNTSPADLGWHPLHIHVNDFQVLSISDPETEIELDPVWYTDTVPLPPGGEVVLRMLFPDFTGRFVYHCHFLIHEDRGMMGVIDVAAPVRISGSTLVPDIARVSAGPTVPHVVNSGTTVVWTNLEHDECMIVADDVDLLTGQPLFASASLINGASFAHTFDAPGTFRYQCTGMDATGLPGAVVVAAEQTIEIDNGAFHPVDVTIAAGTTVAWTNRHPGPHTATADDLDDAGAPRFDTGRIGYRLVGRHTFAEPGDYHYHSDLDPMLTGIVRVRPVTRQSVSVGIVDDVEAQPDVVEVFKDSTVTWANWGSRPWSVFLSEAVQSRPLDPERLFAPGQPLYPGQRFSHTFNVVGDVPFTISVLGPLTTHAGTVRVVQSVELLPYGVFAFEPAAVTIPLDASVAWINRDTIAHTVTVTNAEDEGGEPVFVSEPIAPGALDRFTFGALGTFTYRAIAHPDLAGTIIVELPDETNEGRRAPVGVEP